MSGNEPGLVAAFLEELRQLGYTPGNNLTLEARLARPNTNDTALHAAELSSLGLDFVVVAALPQALAVRRTNPAMPMVIITCPGMVSNGFARTLEQPGGIYTGIDELPPGVTALRLRLLKEAAPAVSRVALLSTTPGVGGHETQLTEAVEAGGEIGVTVRPYRAQTLAELRTALDSIAGDGIDGLLNFQGGLSLANRSLIVDFVATHRIPAIYQSELFVDAGGLMAWAPDQYEQYREGARYADKIIRGARPGDLPVLYPGKYFLTLNRLTAARLEMDISPSFAAKVHRMVP
jgi:putative ABC transport system substrate-binding protein